MKRTCLMILCLLLMMAAPAWGGAQKYDTACFTAQLPAQWQGEEQGPFMVAFAPPTPDTEMWVICQEYLLPDAVLLAREAAAAYGAGAEDTLRMLPDGQGFVFAGSQGKRVWLMESGGSLVRITTLKAHKDLPALLSGFTSDKGNFAGIFATLAKSPAARDWLAFTGSVAPGSPLPPAKAPAMPDFSRYGIEGSLPLPLPRELPAGWSHKTVGLWIVAESGDGGHWAAARLYPVAAGDKEQPDGAPLMETAKEIAAVLGGRNIIMFEGLIYFVTWPGRIGPA